MSAHVHCRWDGKSDPTDSHVDAVAVALAQNHAHLRSKWTPMAFAILNPADAMMHDAGRILDICGGTPTLAELIATVERLVKPRKDGRHVARRDFLGRIFKRLEELQQLEELLDE